ETCLTTILAGRGTDVAVFADVSVLTGQHSYNHRAYLGSIQREPFETGFNFPKFCHNVIDSPDSLVCNVISTTSAVNFHEPQINVDRQVVEAQRPSRCCS